VNDRSARFEALLPPGVRSLLTPCPGQGEASRPVLSWASSPRKLTPHRFRVRSHAIPHAPGQAPTSCITESPAISPRKRDPNSDARVHEPGIRRHARSIEPRAPPSGSDPAHGRLREPRAPATSPAGTSPCFVAERLARAPARRHPAPPAPLAADSREGGLPLDLGDALIEPSTRSTPCGAGWRFTPRGVNL